MEVLNGVVMHFFLFLLS